MSVTELMEFELLKSNSYAVPMIQPPALDVSGTGISPQYLIKTKNLPSPPAPLVKLLRDST